MSYKLDADKPLLDYKNKKHKKRCGKKHLPALTFAVISCNAPVVKELLDMKANVSVGGRVHVRDVYVRISLMELKFPFGFIINSRFTEMMILIQSRQDAIHEPSYGL